MAMAARSPKRRRLSPPDEDAAELSSESDTGIPDVRSGSVDEETFASDVEEDKEPEDSEQEDAAPSKTARPKTTIQDTLDAGTRSRSSQNGHAASKENSARSSVSRGSGTATGSSLLSLQIGEMLKTIRTQRDAPEIAADALLQQVKGIIESIPDKEPQPIARAYQSLQKDGVVMPLRPPLDANYQLAYMKPSSINVTGSYALKTMPRNATRHCIDLVATMPSAIFTEKDYLNHRYFNKRAFYLACIAKGLISEEELKATVQFALFDGVEVAPSILINPPLNDSSKSGKHAPGYTIQVLLAVPENIFPTQKILPVSNCIRSHYDKTQLDQRQLSPTPFYNGAVRSDTLVTQYLKLLHGIGAKHEHFQDACLIGRTWLGQRGFDGSVEGGGFGNFEWSLLVALLLQSGGPNGRPLLSSSFDGHQLFRACVQFLATRDLCQKPVTVGAEQQLTSRAGSTPILFDGPRNHNILYKMRSWSYNSLRKEAQAAVRILSSKVENKFESLFILPTTEPLMCYDLVVGDITVPKATENDSELDDAMQSIEKWYDTLKRGLGHRAGNIAIIFEKGKPTPIHQTDNRLALSKRTFRLGISLDPNNSGRLVERGPDAEDANAAMDFKSFWKEKAELRRFKDGDIRYSVVFDDTKSTTPERQIIVHLVKSHIDQSFNSSQIFPSHTLDGTMDVFETNRKITAAWQLELQAFQRLDEQIRSLPDLPLQIREIKRSNNVIDENDYQVTEVVVQFEGSGRWPDDLHAVQITKLAFLIKLQQSLELTLHNCKMNVGLENEQSDLLNKGFLDVHLSRTHLFRIRVHHEGEQFMMEQRLANKSLSPLVRQEVAFALAEYKRLFVRWPLHIQASRTLATRYSALLQSVHLVRHWFDSHLLSNHFAAPVIESLVTHTFVSPEPWQPPTTAHTALCRTLLFISRWDWQHEPGVVNTGEQAWTATERASILTRFEAWRKVDPSMKRVALFIATSSDPDGTTWTENRPMKVVCARMTALARAAIKLIRENNFQLHISKLFKPSMKDFDFVLWLDPSLQFNRNNPGTAKNTYKNLHKPRETKHADATEAYIRELEEVYGDCLVLFYNKRFQPPAIGGLWNPHIATTHRRWKIGLGYNSRPVEESDEDNLVEFNRESVLAEIGLLGDGIVQRIEVR